MMRQLKRVRNIPFFYDRWVLSISLILVCFGLLMVSSASMVISDRIHHQPFYYLTRQFIYLFSGLVLAWFVARVQLKNWEEMGFTLLLLCFILLLAVLVPGVGNVV